MSTPTSASPTKRARSPDSEGSPLPESKLQVTPSERDRTRKTSSRPPVGMFSTTTLAPVSRRSVPPSSPLKQQPRSHSRLHSSRSATPAAEQPEAADHIQRERLRPPTMAFEQPRQGQPLLPAFQESSSVTTSSSTHAANAATTIPPTTSAIQPSARLTTTASTVTSLPATPDIFGAKECNNVKSKGKDATTELSVAVLLDMLRGPGDVSSIIGSIRAAQSSLAQLTSTYQRVLTAPIYSDDCDHIIKVLEALKQGSGANLATTKAPLPQSAAKPSNSTERSNGTTTAPHLNPEILPHIKAAHDQGFKAGISAAREVFLAEMKARVQEAHNRGFKAGVATATEAPTVGQKDANKLSMEAKEQFERSKEWLRGLVRARDRGEKAQISALISKAENAKWLEHEPEDGFEDQIMVG